jgi:hypothetical protein
MGKKTLSEPDIRKNKKINLLISLFLYFVLFYAKKIENIFIYVIYYVLVG